MKARIVATLLIAAAMMVMTPLAHAQQTHTDPSSRGTTGLFTVPVAAVMGEGEWAFGAFYATAPQQPLDSSIEYSGLSGAVGLDVGKGLEVYGMFEPRMGVHRNEARGTDFSNPRLDDHPLAVNRWGTGIGDLFIGAKARLMGEVDGYDGLAVLAEVRLPTSDTDSGIRTGKVGFRVGIVTTAEFAETLGLSSYLGGNFGASPDTVSLGQQFEYGVGLQVPSRFWVSAIFELSGAIVGAGDLPVTTIDGFASGYDPVYVTFGIRASHESGVAGDVGYTYNANVSGDDFRKDGFLAKVSYTNSRREPVVLMGAAPMSLPPVNRPPTIRLRAERNSVRVGESVRLFADVSDPDGDDLTVTWATQAGSINPRQGETVTWSSQGVRPGSGPVSARVTDGYGGTADAEITLTVTAAPPPPEDTLLTFSCSEFPSGNTRIDNRCKAILDDVALQLRQNPRATAVISGHSDSAGSDDVNNRMSLERADNAETYLVDTHGINANRIDTASAGSGEPIADNSTAEGRLQNRRIVVVVTIPAQ